MCDLKAIALSYHCMPGSTKLLVHCVFDHLGCILHTYNNYAQLRCDLEFTGYWIQNMLSHILQLHCMGAKREEDKLSKMLEWFIIKGQIWFIILCGKIPAPYAPPKMRASYIASNVHILCACTICLVMFWDPISESQKVKRLKRCQTHKCYGAD